MKYTGGGKDLTRIVDNRHILFLQGNKGFDIIITKRYFDKYPLEMTIVHNTGKVSKVIFAVHNDGSVTKTDIITPSSNFAFTSSVIDTVNKLPKIHVTVEVYSSVFVEAIPNTFFYLQDTGYPERINQY